MNILEVQFLKYRTCAKLMEKVKQRFKHCVIQHFRFGKVNLSPLLANPDLVKVRC